MAEKKIELNERNASNTGWDALYPKTLSDIVELRDAATGGKWVWKINNGQVYLEKTN